MPLKRLFAITSLLFFAVLAISPVKNALRPYRSMQRQFARLGASRARSQAAAKAYLARPVSIQQIWLPALNNTVDRCTTCHLGVADPVMAGAPGPFQQHARTPHTPGDFERFGCTACHGGQGLATLQEEAHGAAPGSGGPMIPLAFVEAGCGRCHGAAKVEGADILSRGRALMATAGCMACHKIKGREAFRSEAPPLQAEGLKAGGEALRRWLKQPRSVDPNATMPDFHLTDEQIQQLSHYIASLAAGAATAAQVAAAAQEPAGNAENGKKIFAEARCLSCHTVEGKGNASAPELSKVASKATQGWLLAFIRDPHAFNPRTRMPQFGFSAADSRDVVAYFEAEFKDFDAPKEILDPVRVNQTLAEQGARLFRKLGCFSCHDKGSDNEKFGPDLDGIGDKRASSLEFGNRKDVAHTLPAWLEAKIEDPRSMGQGLKMPSYGFSAPDRRAIVTALLAMGARPVPEAFRASQPVRAGIIPGGRVGAIMDRYRCLSCHQIGSQGGDISTAPLTFEGSKCKPEWVADYLMLSFTIRPILTDRMPVFRMAKDEAALLAQTFETFYRDPAIPDDPFAGKVREPDEGKRLYDAKGCRACHILGAGGGYYGPPLSEAGRRLKPGWVYTWLKGPQKWRADVRCPDYGFQDDEALRLAAYLDTLKATAKPGGAK